MEARQVAPNMSTPFASMRVGEIIETPLCMTEYSSTSPHATPSKVKMKFKRLSNNVSTKAQHYKPAFNVGRFL